MAVNINVPSQVKTYANLAAFPATGALKTIYIAEDTNKTYRWTGSVYTEISASAAMTWGAIGGTLSNQTDLQNALDAKVPTTRTLTINGVTQDLSANRTFTISTGITIGSTAITSGTVGRILFEGAGNVVQQSSSLFWDEAATRFQVGTSSTSPFGSPLIFMGKDQNGETNFQISNSTSGTAATVGFRVFGANNRSTFLGEFSQGHTGVTEFATHYVIEPNAGGVKHGLIISLPETTSGSDFMIYTGGRTASNRRLTLFNGTGNLAIGTTTDAGFRLDVNGTFRASLGQLLVGGGHYLEGIATSSTDATLRFRRTADNGWVRFTLGASSQFFMSGETGTGELRVGAASGHFLTLYSGGSERIRLFNSTGNVGINTTTDAGFRLDVNGTARFKDTGSNSSIVMQYGTGGWIAVNNAGGTEAIRLRGGGGPSYFNTGQNLLIGTTTDVASSLLTLESTTKGFLPPRMTTTQKNAISSPAAGLMVYDTTLNVISYYNGSMWI